MTATYTESARCIHCQADLGNHQISIRVDLGTPTGLSIGEDHIIYLTGKEAEICRRNHGKPHQPNLVATIPQSFLDTVLPD